MVLVKACEIEVGDVITRDGESHTVVVSKQREYSQLWEIWTYPTNRPRAGSFVRYPNQRDLINFESRPDN